MLYTNSPCQNRDPEDANPLNASPLRLGTRGSQLARWQSNWVQQQLEQHGCYVEQVVIKTTGDLRSESLSQIGGQGLFTKRLQDALLQHEIDLAVHSLKDLPTITPGELSIAAVPPREDTRDALVSNRFPAWDKIPSGAVIGTGSARRKAQLLNRRPDLDIREIRGNLDTRLAKLDAGDYDALILAAAGLKRLGWADRIAWLFPPEQMLPAVGQGALGIEVRRNDPSTLAAVAVLDDPFARARVTAERALLRHLKAGCLAPVGADCQLETGRLRLTAVVLSPNGRDRLECQRSAPAENAEWLGLQVGEELLNAGAGPILNNG